MYSTGMNLAGSGMLRAAWWRMKSFTGWADEMASHPDDSPVHLAFFDGLVLRGDSGLDVCTALRLSAAEALGGSDAG